MTDPKSIRSVAEAYAEMTNPQSIDDSNQIDAPALSEKTSPYTKKDNHDTEKHKAERASEAARKATIDAHGKAWPELHVKAANYHAKAAKLHTSLAARAIWNADDNRARHHANLAGMHHAHAENHNNLIDL